MEYGLKKSFDIDNGELDGLAPHECFVLGYELALIDKCLESPAAFSSAVHVENRMRIAKACHDAGREFKLNWMHGDVSESWMQLEVAPK